MSSRYAEVTIGGIYLTHDGTAGGRRCKVSVQNESAFASAYVASSEQSLDFTVHTQVASRGLKGVEFTVVVEYLSEAVLASILAQLDGALAALSAVRVVVASQTSFDVSASTVVTPEGQLYTFESRSGGFARDVQFKFISTGAGA
jgi:hypothetical protein